MAGLVVEIAERTNVSPLKQRVLKVTFDDSYPTGGEVLAASDFGLDYISFVIAEPSGGYVFQYDYSAGKLQAFRAGVHTHTLFLNQADAVDNAGTRVNAATNLIGANSGADISIAGVADTSGHGGVVQAAQAALAEVASTTDLSLVTTRVLAFGR